MFRCATSVFCESASSTIVRNLKTRNVRSPSPIRTCRKKTGPRESSLIETAMIANNGARRRRPAVAPSEVERALQEAGRAREPRRGQPDERETLDRVHLRVRPEHLEHARDDVDLDVAPLHRADDFERLLVRVGRERDRDAMHRVLAHETRAGRTSIRSGRAARRRSARRRESRSTKPTTRARTRDAWRSSSRGAARRDPVPTMITFWM